MRLSWHCSVLPRRRIHCPHETHQFSRQERLALFRGHPIGLDSLPGKYSKGFVSEVLIVFAPPSHQDIISMRHTNPQLLLHRLLPSRRLLASLRMIKHTKRSIRNGKQIATVHDREFKKKYDIGVLRLCGSRRNAPPAYQPPPGSSESTLFSSISNHERKLRMQSTTHL